MELDGKYRHELKYKIHFSEYLAIRQRLRSVMRPDPHAGADGTYQIRSIYFDNVYDKALREKVDGIQKREKFRIRYYNDRFSLITLEKEDQAQQPLYEERCGDHRGRVPGASFRGYGLDAGAFGGAGAGALLQNEESAAAAQGSGFL